MTAAQRPDPRVFEGVAGWSNKCVTDSRTISDGDEFRAQQALRAGGVCDICHNSTALRPTQSLSRRQNDQF